MTENLNGSVNLLASGLRKVITEAMEKGTAPIKKDMEVILEQQIALSDRMGDLVEEVSTDRQNNQEQFRKAHEILGQLKKASEKQKPA